MSDSVQLFLVRPTAAVYWGPAVWILFPISSLIGVSQDAAGQFGSGQYLWGPKSRFMRSSAAWPRWEDSAHLRFRTTVLDAGVSLRDVLIAARRADSEPPCCSSSRSPMVGCW